MPELELLVADLRTLSKRIGALTGEALVAAPNLLALPRYRDLARNEERHDALLDDLARAIEDLPDYERGHARLLLSYEAAGTNITHRRQLAGMDSLPNVTVKWREHYTLALLASRLLALAGRSAIEDAGPGYRHDLITYKTTIHLDNPKQLHIEWIYDIEIIRDGTYIYMIGEQTRDAGSMVAPWQVTTGQIHVGDVPFDPTATDGTTLHIIYLGRRYMKGEKVRIETTETRLYPVVDAQGSAGIQSGRLPSPLLIEVHCPLNLAPTYERIEFEGNSVNAPPLLTDEIIRTSDKPMTFYIENSRPVTRYAIHWKWALPI